MNGDPLVSASSSFISQFFFRSQHSSQFRMQKSKTLFNYLNQSIFSVQFFRIFQSSLKITYQSSNPTNKIESNRCSAFCMISNHTNTPNQPRSIPIYFPFLSTSRFVVVYDGISVLFFVSSLSLFCNALFCLVLLFHFTSFSFSSLSLSLEMVVNIFVSEWTWTHTEIVVITLSKTVKFVCVNKQFPHWNRVS